MTSLKQLIDHGQARLDFLGDTALLVSLLEQAQQPLTSAQARRVLLQLSAQLPSILGAAYRDHCFGLDSLALTIEPCALEWDDAQFFDRIAAARITLDAQPQAGDEPERRYHEIPLCYPLGLDFEALQQRFGLSADALIARHSAALYEVRMLGFLPGLPYISPVSEFEQESSPEIDDSDKDNALMIPRLDTPRVAVPAGSVGIANGMSVIYPQQSPGGWWLIGRTPLLLFRAQPEPSARLRAGDRLRFVPISKQRFDQLSAEQQESAPWD